MSIIMLSISTNWPITLHKILGLTSLLFAIFVTVVVIYPNTLFGEVFASVCHALILIWFAFALIKHGGEAFETVIHTDGHHFVARFHLRVAIDELPLAIANETAEGGIHRQAEVFD